MDIECREQRESSETEEDMYDYTSPTPLEYEVPDNRSDTPPDIPEREKRHIKPPPSHPPPTLPKKHGRIPQGQAKGQKVYTPLTHQHLPTVYSTPSHSQEFRSNIATADHLDVVNLEFDQPTSPQAAHKTKGEAFASSKSRSRAKVAILVFLFVAVVVGTISLVVSLAAVFLTSDSDSSGTVTMDDITALQEEVQQLQTVAETNQTRATVDLSSFYDSCDIESKRRECIFPRDFNEFDFPCPTDPLTLEKEVCTVM